MPRVLFVQAADNTLLLASRLLQQFVVDMYVKLETTRLDYYRRKQTTIRSELYQGIVDSVISAETKGCQVGKRMILPASFVGGPRDMRRRYLYAMALVQHFGKPDLFITMTCNPEWREIKNELKPGQLPQDRPDLTSRVFRAKLQDLKDQLFKKEIFGKVAAHVYVIEFQKRGLSHAHMLIILKPGYKITTPNLYDKFVCAEIPDERDYSLLHEMVVKHMMHGLCGEKNKKKPLHERRRVQKSLPTGVLLEDNAGKRCIPNLQKNWTYFIENSVVKGVNERFSNVHKEIELSLNVHTEVN
ncbi:hypothetical protein L1049_013590 [Liquidambar formosana]|uniref:Helitron helicase-like domain-containing protein n=1 Tax=Liquidambar formosana TaxID=63359 RepID=A0AAP0RKJ8_LIQFO